MATRFYAFYSLFLLLVLATYCDGLRDPRLPGSPLTETSGTTLNRLGRRDEEACADIGSHEDACGYVLSHCASLEAALPFLKFYYCSLPGVPWVAMFLLVVSMLALFAVFATTASQFFVPNINGITSLLGISETVAGVTFAAFGNGAPDIFSSLAAFSNSESGGLAFGELLGAAMFILTVVMGVVAIISPFPVAKFPFIRDIVFFMGALVVILSMLGDQSINMVESVILVVYYFVYVSVVVFSHSFPALMSRFEENRVQLVENPLLGDSPTSPTDGAAPRATNSGGWWSTPVMEASEALPPPIPSNRVSRGQSTAMDLQRSLIRPSLLAAEGSADGGIALPLNEGDRTLNIERDLPALLPVSHKTMDLLFPWYSRFNSLRPWKRVLGILGAPIWVMLRLTVPVVDEATMDFAGAPPLGNSDFDRSTRDSVEYSDGTLMAEDDDISPGPLHSPPGNDGMPPWARFSRAPLRWHRWLSAINLATFPTIFVLGVFGGDSTVGDSAMPSWSLSLIIGLAVSALFVLTTRNDQPPRWYGALAFVGFTAGIVWIYMIANLLVGLLQTLGIIFGVSEALMGLTIFAWGNSMGDLMTDVSLARMGYAELAMGACYGSPMLNIVLGIGLGGLVSTVKAGSRHIDVDISLWASTVGLLAALAALSIIIPLQGFRTTRATGFVLISVYSVYVVIQLLLAQV